MAELSQKRCFHHGGREAAGICLACQRFFCRECLTEHDSKVICASCLGQQTSSVAAGSGFEMVRALGFFFLALLILWFLFYRYGLALVELPASFHEGTLWKDLWQNLN